MTHEETAQALLDVLPALRNYKGTQAVSEVTAGEFAALLYLVKEHNGSTAGELTAGLRVDSSRTTAILQSMERKGLLQRERDPDDGRRVLIYLTDKGYEVERKQRETSLESINGLLNYLGQEDAEKLTVLLGKVVAYQEAGL